MASPRATPAATAAFRDRHPHAAPGHFREQQGLWLSSIGIGTYLGDTDEDTDRAYTGAVVRAVELGANVIDSAINYRFQRSERSIGEALRRLSAAGAPREELVVCTKAGFLTPDGAMPANAQAYLRQTYLETGILSPEEIAGGMHSMAPRFLADQMERSRRNLGIDCLDVFYLHNPETQLAATGPAEFARRVRAAFELLEREAADGRIQFYGTATWNAFRRPSTAADAVSLEALAGFARDVAGDRHRFRFVQLPFNLAMPEAFTTQNQALAEKRVTLLDVARQLGITVVASASLMQAQLASGLPDVIGQAMSGLRSDAQRALQFVRSTPGISVALVGMKSMAHVEENLSLVRVAPASHGDYMRLYAKA